MKNIILIAFLIVVTSFNVSAHQLSTAYINLQNDSNDTVSLSGSWQVAVADIEQAIPFDLNQDNVIIWQEISAKQAAIASYLLNHITAQQAGATCTVSAEGSLKLDNHFNQAYIDVPLQIYCPEQSALTLSYNAIMQIDANHKAIAAINNTSRVFSRNNQQQTLNFSQTSYGQTFVEYVYQGILHIWMGVDHILFLVALLLTCVLVRDKNTWQGIQSKKKIAVDTAWIVTAFTLAHSITLTATALELVSPNSRWVELGIALSVLFAALNNIWPLIVRLGWVTFAFGLLHGMGFASVLGELGLSSDYQLMSILAFNLGVEVGQLVILAICLPVLISLRNRDWYRKWLMPAGSLTIAVIALQWSIERF
ncbi:HupE/UreJ family protein [Pseudoalteromonas lipolytica]